MVDKSAMPCVATNWALYSSHVYLIHVTVICHCCTNILELQILILIESALRTVMNE
jgi:hypothetical protein